MSDVHTVAAIALKKNDNTFGIVTSKRQYYVRASNAKEMHAWIDALKEVQHQVQQSSTMTQDMAAVDLATSSGGENLASPPGSRTRQISMSPQTGSLDRQQSVKGNSNTTPINIIIPGKGLYTSPAQARQNSTGGGILSPLTATSESDSGTAHGAEQFGMSYASSTSHNLGSSPNRHGGHQFHSDHSSGGGRASPHSHSGGDELSDGTKKPKIVKKSSTGIVEATGGEGSGTRTGWTASKGSGQGQTVSQQQQSSQHNTQQVGAVLSSSDEDGEGDDWDEDEIADQAMPLPGSSTVTSTLGNQNVPTGASTESGTSTNTKANVESHHFKDPNKVILQGYLMKQSSRRKQWRKRYFTLTSSYLAYSRNHMNGKAHRQIPLTSILDAIEYTSKKPQNLQSPPPSSPGLPSMLSPPLLPPAITFQLGGGNQDAPSGSNAAQKEGGAATTKAGESSAEHPGIDRKSSLLGASSTPNTPRKKKENCFKIITPKRTYVVGAPTEEEEIKWLCALQALLAHWRGIKDAESVEGSKTASNSTNANTTSSSNQQSSHTPAATVTTPTKPVRRGSTAMEDVSVHG